MAKKPTPKVITKKHLARIERERIQNRYIMIAAIVVLVLVVGTVGYGILDQTYLSARRPVAKVGNESITTQEWQIRTRFARTQLINQYNQTMQLASYFGTDPNTSSYFQSQLSQISSQLNDTSGMADQVLTEMIDEIVIRQEANKVGITVSQADIDQAMQSAFGYYPNGTPTPTITPTFAATETLSPTQLALVTITPTPTTPPTETPTVTPTGPTPTVAPTETSTPTPSGPTPTVLPSPSATPYTLEGYQKVVSDYVKNAKSIGLTDQEMRKIFEAQLYRQKLEEYENKDLKPFREEVWARQILVPDQVSAEAVEARLKKGEDFGKIAAEVSTDTASKANGGDLSWFPRGQMIKEFEDAAFSLKIGEISQPVKSSFGYHIIQVLGHENKALTSSEFQQYKNTTFSDWLTKTKDKYDIKKYDAVIKGAVPTDPVLNTSGSTIPGQ